MTTPLGDAARLVVITIGVACLWGLASYVWRNRKE